MVGNLTPLVGPVLCVLSCTHFQTQSQSASEKVVFSNGFKFPSLEFG